MISHLKQLFVILSWSSILISDVKQWKKKRLFFLTHYPSVSYGETVQSETYYELVCPSLFHWTLLWWTRATSISVLILKVLNDDVQSVDKEKKQETEKPRPVENDTLIWVKASMNNLKTMAVAQLYKFITFVYAELLYHYICHN